MKTTSPLLALAVLFAGALTVSPAHGEVIPLWPKGAPGAKGDAKEDIPTLKIFPAPAGTEEPVPAVLLIPGGGYKHIQRGILP
jgi:hypothetical protein